MEFRQLEYFQMVSKLKNFTKAAEKLHVSQPSITNSIRKLENELGVLLLDRNKKRVRLTEEGKVFLNRVNKILFELNDTILEIKDLNCLNKGSIKLGLPPMIGAYLFPDIFTKFKHEYPQLDLKVFEEGSISACNMLEKGELDLGIIILPKDSKELNTLQLYTEQIVLCVAHDHKFANYKSIHFSQLKDENLILLKEDSFHRKFILQSCINNNFSPNIIFSSNQIETIKGLVESGVGVSFLMELVTRNTDRIVGVPLTEPIEIKIGLAWKKDKYLSKASRAFIDFIKKYAKTYHLSNKFD